MNRHDTEFLSVARAAFADLRAEFRAMWPSVTPSQFTGLCRERLPDDPTATDYIAAASALVREATEDTAHWDRVAEDFENARILEAGHFVSESTERDWT